MALIKKVTDRCWNRSGDLLYMRVLVRGRLLKMYLVRFLKHVIRIHVTEEFIFLLENPKCCSHNKNKRLGWLPFAHEMVDERAMKRSFNFFKGGLDRG